MSATAQEQPEPRTARPPQDVTDERGDFIFRFELDTRPDEDLTLRELYRAHLHDVLGVVRLYMDGKPVIVNGFAFLNAPEDVVPILPDGSKRAR